MIDRLELICILAAVVIICLIIRCFSAYMDKTHDNALNPGKFIQQLTRDKHGHYAPNDDGYDIMLLIDADIDWGLYDYLIHGLTITPGMAKKLEKAFPGWEAQKWLNLQANWDLHKKGERD